MKKAVLLILLVILLATSVTPALADGGGGQHRTGKRFALVGVVTAKNDETQTLTVEVLMGNRLVKPYIGQELTISTTERTRYRRYGDPKGVFITFGDIEVDDGVAVGGVYLAATNTFVADRITVIPLRPRP